MDLRSIFTDYLLLNNTTDLTSGILTADTVHMNDTGNQLLADAFEDALLTRVPEIGNITMSMSGSTAVFCWAASPSASYTLQGRTNLVEGSWSNLIEDVSGTNGLMSLTNLTDGPISYFRIRGN